jgi:hypothetical protein
MKNKYHTNEQNQNRQILEIGKIDTPNTHIHDCSLSWLGTCTSVKGGGPKLLSKPKSNYSNLHIRQAMLNPNNALSLADFIVFEQSKI